jgi:hypothetical protein
LEFELYLDADPNKEGSKVRFNNSLVRWWVLTLNLEL